MNKIDEGFSIGNTLDLSILNIELLTGEVLNLKNLLHEMNIYVSLFNPGITSTLIIGDPTNITNNGPIIGGEKIFIKWRSPYYREFSEMMFKVERVGDRVPTTAQAAIVTLHLVSADMYDAESYNPSYGMRGQYSAIATKLWANGAFMKELKVDNSYGIFNYASPENQSILSTMSWLANRSQGAEGLPYVFYEDIDEFVFASMAKILRQDTKVKLFHQPQLTEESVEKIFRNCYSVQFVENRDAGMWNQLGFGGCEETVYDPLTKTAHYANRSFENYALNSPRLDAGELKVLNRQSNVRRMTLQKEDGSHATVFNRAALNYSLQNSCLKIATPGDDQMRVGVVGEINMAAVQVQNEQDIVEEKFISGRFLVTHLKHTIRPSEYRLYWNLAKESYHNEVEINEQRTS